MTRDILKRAEELALEIGGIKLQIKEIITILEGGIKSNKNYPYDLSVGWANFASSHAPDSCLPSKFKIERTKGKVFEQRIMTKVLLLIKAEYIQRLSSLESEFNRL